MDRRLQGQITALAFFLLMLAPAALPAQPRTGLGSLYGSQNMQYVVARYMPVMVPDPGYGGEVMFGFNTSSSKTERQKHWKRFGGVSVGGGGMYWPEGDFGDYEERQASAAYVLLQIEGKQFYTVEGPIRPYWGASAGFGLGSIWMEREEILPDPPVSGMNFLAGGLETGVHVPVRGRYSLVVAIGFDARVLQYGTTGAYFAAPVYLTVGFSQWKGPIRE